MALARDYPELVGLPQEDGGIFEENILLDKKVNKSKQEEQEC